MSDPMRPTMQTYSGNNGVQRPRPDERRQGLLSGNRVPTAEEIAAWRAKFGTDHPDMANAGGERPLAGVVTHPGMDANAPNGQFPLNGAPQTGTMPGNTGAPVMTPPSVWTPPTAPTNPVQPPTSGGTLQQVGQTVANLAAGKPANTQANPPIYAKPPTAPVAPYKPGATTIPVKPLFPRA